MSSNINSIQDEDGDYSDWIELINNSDNTLSLLDFGLSDDLNNPFKWTFPNIRLAPNEIYVVYASGKDKTEWYNNWETIISQGDLWEYQIGNENIPENWYTEGYNTNWPEGFSGFGFGDGDDVTIIDSTAISIYIKKEFEIFNISDIQAAILHVDYDDGFVAYLNGFEIGRANLGNEGEIIRYNALASSTNEASIISGRKPERFRIDQIQSIFKEGKNILAIQVHNATASSSDLSLIPFLSISRNNIQSYQYNVPDVLVNTFNNIHSNFKISADGEEIILTNKYGNTEDAVDLPQISSDISYGRSMDEFQTWGVFYEPTPWEDNFTEIHSQISIKPKFSKSSGFYSKSFFLELEYSDGRIFYTRDGSIPDSTSTLYSNSIYIDRTTVIRARSYSTNSLPSDIKTKTFIIGETTDLPVISISTNPDNLWDNEIGIYALGTNASTEFPYDGANFWQDWERPIHIEMFESNGDQAFALDAGVKIHGGWTRGNAQKSLAVFARAKYGTKEIDYKIFPDLKYDKFNSLVLRNSGSDWDYTMFRDGFMDKLVENTSLAYQAHRPAVVFLNGEYWGIHNIREKINEDYLFTHYNVDPNNVDIILQDGFVVEGDDDEYWKLINFLKNSDLSIDDSYNELNDLIDINNFLEYYAAEIYFDNTDWPSNNIKLWREKADSAKWRMILYDTDFGFGLLDTLGYSHNTLEFATTIYGQNWPNPPSSTFILRKLLENNKIKNDFINQFSRYFNTSFTKERVEKIINQFKGQIEKEMPQHISKWKTFTLRKWDENINILKVFNNNRIDHLKDFIISKFLLPGLADVYIGISDPSMGKVIFDNIKIKEEAWQGEYFQNSIVQLVADPKKYFEFSHWEGNINSSNPIMEVKLSKLNEFIAVFKPEEDSSKIVINEINYNSHKDFNTKDWVEFYNPTENEIDISGWVLKDSSTSNTFVFPTNSIISENDFLVAVQDSNEFKSYFPEVKNFIGNLSFGFNNDGESISLYDNSTLIDSVKYNDKSPWPTRPDGMGYSLELVNYKFDNNNPDNWKRSLFNGTPGRVNDRLLEDSINRDHSEISLYQNFPNPFNNNTIISFSLPTKENVSLEIFDILGRKIRTIVKGDLKKGFYSEYWDGKNNNNLKVNSGIYIIRLKNDNTVLTKKTLLLN